MCVQTNVCMSVLIVYMYTLMMDLLVCMCRGISFTLNGFTPKLGELAQSVLTDISEDSRSLWTQVLQQSLIDVCKEKTLRGMKSCKLAARSGGCISASPVLEFDS